MSNLTAAEQGVFDKYANNVYVNRTLDLDAVVFGNITVAQALMGGVAAVLLILCIIECICGCMHRKRDTAILYIRPFKDRHCTDLALLASFIIFLGATAAFGYIVPTYGGDPNKFLYGIDMRGNICGFGYMKDKPYTAWPYPSKDNFYIRICLADCNETLSSPNIVAKFPTKSQFNYCLPDIEKLLNNSQMLSATMKGSAEAMVTFYESNKYAVAVVEDTFSARNLLFATPAIGLVFSFLYLVYTRFCTGCMVASIILMIVLGFAVSGYFLFTMANDTVNPIENPDYKLAMEICAYVSWGISVITILVVFFMRDRIRLAIAVVEEAAKCFFQIPSMLFFPLGPFACGVAFVVYWLYGAIYIYTITKSTEMDTPDEVLYEVPPGFGLDSVRKYSRNSNPTKYYKNEWDKDFQYTALYWVFTFFWIMQFFVYFIYHVLAGTVAEWYFSPREDNGYAAPPKPDKEVWSGTDKEDGDKGDEAGACEEETKPKGQGCCAVGRSCCRTCRFHLGSVAFGSLILAIINTIRVMVKYIEHNSSLIRNERIKKAVFCAIQCLLKCLECCLDKLSKNAFVWQAVTGNSFLTSACEAFITLIRNFDRVAMVSTVSHFITSLGPVAVGAVTSAFVGGLLKFTPLIKINTILGPVFLAFFVGFFTCKCVMVVFNCTIDTIFLCYLIDEHHNLSGTMMAPISMQKLVKDTSDINKKKADTSHSFNKSKNSVVVPEPPSN